MTKRTTTRTPTNLETILLPLVSFVLLAAAACNRSDDPTTTTSPIITSIAVSGSPTVAVGAQTQLVATATLSDGTMQDFTAQASFTSSNEAVATVTPSGVLTGVSEGTATITAIVQGRSGTHGITVTPG